jgi:hypothetical protein
LAVKSFYSQGKPFYSVIKSFYSQTKPIYRAIKSLNIGISVALSYDIQCFYYLEKAIYKRNYVVVRR